MEINAFFERAELLNLRELYRKRPHWTDRLPRLPEPPSRVTMYRLKRHPSFLLPHSLRNAYMLWLARQRYRVNLEQIELDELDEICELEVDSSGNCKAVWDKHAKRRVAARFLVAMRERRRLERLARRWDVDATAMITRGEADEVAIAAVRRGVREARWVFVERCSKTLIPCSV